MITKYEKSLHTRYQTTNIYYTAAGRFLQSYTHIHTHTRGGEEKGVAVTIESFSKLF